MIVLRKEDWKARAFFWALDIVDEFTMREGSSRHCEATNLCYFVRVITVYLPLILALHVALVGAAVYVALVSPWALFGGIVWTVVWSLVATVIVYVKWAHPRISDWRFNRSLGRGKKLSDEGNEIDASEKLARGPSLWSLMWTWMCAMKQRVCPMIQFREPKETVNA